MYVKLKKIFKGSVTTADIPRLVKSSTLSHRVKSWVTKASFTCPRMAGNTQRLLRQQHENSSCHFSEQSKLTSVQAR